MGYINGFVKGIVIGTIAGVFLAPQPGGKTRDQIRRFLSGARDGAEDARAHVPQSADDSARKVWDGAAAALDRADNALGDSRPAPKRAP